MSPADRGPGRHRAVARAGWLLSAPALVVLSLAAVGPLFIVVVYSFLTAGRILRQCGMGLFAATPGSGDPVHPRHL